MRIDGMLTCFADCYNWPKWSFRGIFYQLYLLVVRENLTMWLMFLVKVDSSRPLRLQKLEPGMKTDYKNKGH